jgi:hypothetical protein
MSIVKDYVNETTRISLVLNKFMSKMFGYEMNEINTTNNSVGGLD